MIFLMQKDRRSLRCKGISHLVIGFHAMKVSMFSLLCTIVIKQFLLLQILEIDSIFLPQFVHLKEIIWFRLKQTANIDYMQSKRKHLDLNMLCHEMFSNDVL